MLCPWHDMKRLVFLVFLHNFQAEFVRTKTEGQNFFISIMLLSLRLSDFETHTVDTGIKIQIPVGIRLPITTYQIKSKTINTQTKSRNQIFMELILKLFHQDTFCWNQQNLLLLSLFPKTWKHMNLFTQFVLIKLLAIFVLWSYLIYIIQTNNDCIGQLWVY